MPVRKILLVDDSPAQLKEMQAAVSGIDAHVVTATSGKEAVEKAKAEYKFAEENYIDAMELVKEGVFSKKEGEEKNALDQNSIT